MSYFEQLDPPSWRRSTDRANLSWEFLNASPSSPSQILYASVAYRCLTTLLLVLLFVGDSWEMSQDVHDFFVALEITAVLIFSAEYLLRLYLCADTEPLLRAGTPAERLKVRLWHAITPMMLCELIAILALILDLTLSRPSTEAPQDTPSRRPPAGTRIKGLSTMRLFRLFTILRFERHFSFFRPVLDVVVEKRAELGSTVGIAALLLFMSSTAMWYIEGPENAEFNNLLDALWWSTTALTTVGYGDIVPKSGWGKFVAALTAFIGVGVFALPTGIVASGFQDRLRTRVEQQRLSGPPAASQGEAQTVAAAPRDTRLDELCGRVGLMEGEVAGLRSDLQRVLQLLEQQQHLLLEQRAKLGQQPCAPPAADADHVDPGSSPPSV